MKRGTFSFIKKPLNQKTQIVAVLSCLLIGSSTTLCWSDPGDHLSMEKRMTSNSTAKTKLFTPTITPSPTPTPWISTPTATFTPTPTTTPSPTATPSGNGITIYREIASDTSQLTHQPATDDDIAGVDATTLSGGFHPAVTDPDDQTPAFTDGIGLNVLAGLLDDNFRGLEGTAAWSGFWLLSAGQPTDLNEIRVFAANNNQNEYRSGQHYDAYVTSDPTPGPDSQWTLLTEEVTTMVFGTQYDADPQATLSILQSTNGPLASQVTALRLDFYPTDSFGTNYFVDDWNPGSPNDQDGFERAIASPFIVEVDVYVTNSAITPTSTPSPTATPTATPSISPTITPSPSPCISTFTQMAATEQELDQHPDQNDDLAGVVATTLSGGFHPVVEEPEDMTPAFTDGVGFNTFAGLLRDLNFPDREGMAAWSGFWLLDDGEPADLYELRVFSANDDQYGGRSAHHYDAYVTDDPNPGTDSQWTLLIENVTTMDFGSKYPVGPQASYSSIKSCQGVLASQVTALRLDFYATDIFDQYFVDDWNADSPEDQDGLESAFMSPLIVEVDAFCTPSPCISTFTQMAATEQELDQHPDQNDDLAGVVATTLSGGFHPVVEEPEDMNPAFTDGIGFDTFAGLLRDLNFPDREGMAAWSGFWLLDDGEPADLNEFRVFSSNPDDINGQRCAQHYDVFVTNDPNPGPDSEWVLLMEEVTTMDFGTPHDPNTRASCSSLRSCNGVLASQITALRLDFYATDSIDLYFVDDWNAGSPEDQDGLDSAFISPLIVEVDAYINQEKTPVFYDFPPSGNGDGWTFTRPEMYRDIEGEYNPDTQAWDVTLTNNEMSFGFLESPVITADSTLTPPTPPNSITGSTGPENLYRANYLISSDIEDPTQVPVIRTRVSCESFQRSDLTVITSQCDESISPGSQESFYTTYFQLPENENNFRLDLDILNFDPSDAAQGTLSLHFAEIEFIGNINQLENGTTVLNENFVTNGQSGWDSYPKNEGLIPTPDTYSANTGTGLLIRGSNPSRQEPTEPIALFGYWGKRYTTTHPLTNSLYCIRWTIGSDTDINHLDQVPTFRLRFNDASMKLASLVNIDSVPENANLPSADNPVTYDSWFVVPPEIAGNNWDLSFDYLYVEKPAPIADDPTIALMLESVEVMRYDIP